MQCDMKTPIRIISLLCCFVVLPFASAKANPLSAEEGSDVHEYRVHVMPTSWDGPGEYEASVYYGDSYFASSPTIYNPHLSTLSLAMSAASFPPYDDEVGITPAWYAEQPLLLGRFFEDLGFSDYEYNEDYAVPTRFDTIGLGAARKTIRVDSDNYTLIACCPRSGQYGAEWGNNFFLGSGDESDSMHEGWYNAAKKEIAFIQDYARAHSISGKVKLWLSGFSRGGAVANLTAALLDNMLDKGEAIFENTVTFSKEDLYAYTFEAPQGAHIDVKQAKKPKDAIYDNIFNIINPNDAVAKVAMSAFGFTRFGRDKYITTRFYDPENYVENRAVFKKFYDGLAENMAEYAADDFEMYGMSVGSFGTSLLHLVGHNPVAALSSIIEKDKRKANWDANLVERMLLDEICDCVGSRAKYVKNFQTGLVDVLDMFMGSEEWSFDIGMTILSVPGALVGFVLGAIGYAITESKTFVDAMFSLFDAFIPEEHIQKIVKVAAPLMKPLVDVYWEKPNECISFAKYCFAILQNHYTEVVFAHLKAHDSYYTEAYNNTHEDKVRLVELRDNADYGRMRFFGFNDLGLRLDSKEGERIVNVEGHVCGKSDIKECSPYCAVGYYSYATEEKMELFFPIGRKYNISMKDYSKKPRHRVEYWAYRVGFALGNEDDGMVRIDHHKKTAYFNSDRYKRDVDYR